MECEFVPMPRNHLGGLMLDDHLSLKSAETIRSRRLNGIAGWKMDGIHQAKEKGNVFGLPRNKKLIVKGEYHWQENVPPVVFNQLSAHLHTIGSIVLAPPQYHGMSGCNLCIILINISIAVSSWSLDRLKRSRVPCITALPPLVLFPAGKTYQVDYLNLHGSYDLFCLSHKNIIMWYPLALLGASSCHCFKSSMTRA